MGLRFPEGTVFRRVWLDVENRSCRRCGGGVKICDHRHHRIWTLQGAWHLTSRLVHCSEGSCPGHHATISPESELSITMPHWGIGWDLFCWVGHRRFARHWSVPQMRAELFDSYGIRLSADAIEKHIKRYRHMVAARQEDMKLLREAYRDVGGVILTIDGLQPEKGHETLYVVRELVRKRVWFAEALLSSSAGEVRRLLVRAKQMAAALGTFVELWMSDKQDAFVTGIAAEFVGVPHRFCQNHFMRDLAKPTLETASHAKVQMRSKVRGLRAIEREVLHEAQTAVPTVEEAAERDSAVGTGGPAPTAPSPAAQVVLDYCASVRGILNDDQGGPLHPPGLRMAAGLAEVRASLTKSLAAKKGGASSRC